MSDEREASRAAETPETAATPGAPVEETEASQTEVLRAVERSRVPGAEETVDDAQGATRAAAADVNEAEAAAAAERAHREEVSLVDTELNLEPPSAQVPSSAAPLTREETSALPALDDLPSAAAAAPTASERDGEIRISSDHPMAGLYVQSPLPPDIKGNRGAGALIALVATIGFAIVFAGVLALWLAPTFPPSTFLTEAFVPWVTSWPVIAAVVAFFLGLLLVVLIVGRAGWWAYVLGGFFVAALVWVAVTLSLAYFGTPFETPREMLGGSRGWSGDLQTLVTRFGLTVPALGAALVAREATVWFGAWIGARGRRVKLRNARELADYETALAESQTAAQA